MKWYKNLKISVKLVLAFLVIALIAGGVGTFGVISLLNINSSDDVLFENNGNSQGYLGYVMKEFYNQRTLYQDIIMLADDSKTATYVDEINDSVKNMTDNLTKYKTTCVSEEDKTNYNTLETGLNNYAVIRENILASVQKGDYQGANTILRSDNTVQVTNDAVAALKTAMDDEVTSAASEMNGQSASIDTSTIIMIVLVAAAVVLAIVIGLFISRLLSRPVKQMSDVAVLLSKGVMDADNVDYVSKDEIGQMANALNATVGKLKDIINEISYTLGEMSKGNLDVEITSEYPGNFAAIKEAINGIIDSLNATMGDINKAADQVASGASQVSDGVQETSQGATEQAGSIEELTSSVTQIAQQTKQNAMSANNANELTVSAAKDAVHGNEQMKAMQQAMGEISESSRSINKIIKVIDDIAFQTNILALNAAVEAARAGVHGKGFAVVAEEVRNLAAKSANAAKETTDLIEGSIRKTEAGTKIAGETASALSSIVEGVDKAAKLVSEIARASNEQAGAIAQVNIGIEQMSQVVQSNSATAEEGAAASEELSSQAELLKNMVGRFRLNTGAEQRKASEPARETRARKMEEKPKAPTIKMSDADFGKY